MERLKNMKENLMNCVEGQISENLQNVSAEELGEAVDMIKDLSEAIYYCTLTEEMDKCKKEEEVMKFIYPQLLEHERQMRGNGLYDQPYQAPMLMEPGQNSRMYYDGGSNGGSSSGGNSGGGNSGGGSSSGGSAAYGGGSRGYSQGGRGGRRGFEEGRLPYEGGMYPPMPMMYNSTYPAEIRDFREGRSPMTRRTYMESKEKHQDKGKQMQELEKYTKELCQDVLEMVEDASPEEKMILSQKLNTLAEKIQ